MGKDIQIISRVSGSYDLTDYDDPAVSFDQAPKMENTYRIKLTRMLDNMAMDNIRYSYLLLWRRSETIANINTISAYDPDAYAPPDGEVNFIYETGELILVKVFMKI